VEAEHPAQLVELVSQPTSSIARRKGIITHQWPQSLDHFRDGKQALDPGQVDSAVVDEPFDELYSLELVARVQTHAADGARGLNQPEPLVLPQRLWMHAEHACGDADEKEIVFEGHRANPASIQI